MLSLYESIPISTILILGPFGLGMEVLAWYIDPNGIKNNTVKHPYPTGIRKDEILLKDTQMV